MTADEALEAGLRAQKDGNVEAAKFFAAEHLRLREAAAPAGTEEATAAASGVQSQQQARTRLVRGMGEGLAQVGAQAVKDVAGMALLPGELLKAGINKLAGDPPEFGRATDIITGAVDEVVPPPKSEMARRGLRVGSGILTGAILPGSATRNAITGGLGALGGELGSSAGGAIGGDNGAVIGGILGSLGLGAPNTLYRGRGNYKQMLAESIKGLQPGDFAEAARIKALAAQYGVTLTPEQLFNKQSGLDALMRETLESGAGRGDLQKLVLGQREQGLQAADMGGRSLGPNPGAASATRDLRLAAEGAISDRKLTPSQSRLFNEDGVAVDPATLKALDSHFAVLADEFKASPATVARIQGLRQQLAGVTDSVQIAGAPKVVRQEKGAAKWATEPTTESIPLGAKASDLDTIVKEARAALKDLSIASPATARLQTGRVGGAVAEIDRVLNQLTPTRVQGKDIYGRMQEGKEALTSSLVGRLAGKAGVNEAAPDSLGLIKNVLGSGKPQQAELAELASVLRQRAENLKKEAARVAPRDDILAGELMEEAAQATRAMPQAARTIFDEALGRATQQAGGRTPANFGSTLSADLIGTPAKEANFHTLMMEAGSSLQTGQDPKQFADGMVNLLKTLGASGRNREGVKLATGDIHQIAGQSLVRDAAQAMGPLSRISLMTNKLRDAAYERQYGKLADIFSNPDALRIVQQMGTTPVISSRQGALLSALIQVINQGQQKGPAQ